jgi:osmotically inducible protein OsmC
MAVSKSEAIWNGTLKEGAGTMSVGSGFVKEVPYTFVSRFEEDTSKGTNPEELIGAAQAGCFSMFLAAQLTNAGFKPARIQTSATVHLGAGPTITKIELDTVAEVPGVDQKTFDEKVATSKANCPVSKALASVGEIVVNAKLVS